MNRSIIVRFDGQYAEHIKKIRNTVFTREQGIDKALDFDDRDVDAIHVLVRADDEYVGTGRMLNDGHIGRLAVLKEHREKGYGAAAVAALMLEAKDLGMKRVFLGAQLSAVGFYEKLAFRAYGEPFLDAGIEHIQMEKAIV
ncbi:GNAT family N-acetyltransferase [bacterium]|nr:GNAT family N-acetyltransferase [bacterium]